MEWVLVILAVLGYFGFTAWLDHREAMKGKNKDKEAE